MPRALAAWEEAAQVAPQDRRSTPLFCGRGGWGTALTQSELTQDHHRLLRWVVGEEAGDYSVHMYRAYLASALMAAGKSDAEIQVALRWASPEALQIYKIANVEQYAGWLVEAERQTLTGTRAIGLPRVLPQTDHLERAAMLAGAGRDLQERAALDDAALRTGAQATEDGAPDYDTTGV